MHDEELETILRLKYGKLGNPSTYLDLIPDEVIRRIYREHYSYKLPASYPSINFQRQSIRILLRDLRISLSIAGTIIHHLRKYHSDER